jgi:uncharacterized damage-inducible protein DinB
MSVTQRNWQLDSMEKSLLIAEQLLLSISDSLIFDKRDGRDGWTISEVFGHLLDAEVSFYNRAKLTIEQDNPPLPLSDPNQIVIEKGYANQNAMDIFKQWQESRVPYLDYLRSLPEDNATWERTAQHPRRGEITLTEQLMLAAWHDTNHLHQIAKIIQS